MICPALHSNNEYIQSKTSQTWCAIQKRVACIGSVLLCLQAPNSSFKTIRYSTYLVGRSVDKNLCTNDFENYQQGKLLYLDDF